MFTDLLNKLDVPSLLIGAIASCIAVLSFLVRNPDKLRQLIRLFKKTPLSKKLHINTNAEIYKGVHAYENAIAFQKSGFGYIENYKCDLAFNFHSKIKGTFNIKQICKTADYLCLGDFDAYKIDIPKSDMIFYTCTRIVIILLTLLFLVSCFILFCECFVYVNTLQEKLKSINNIFFSGYLIFLLSIVTAPIRYAKKVARFLKKEKFFIR